MAAVTVAYAQNGVDSGSTTGASSYASGSFTPVAGDLIIIICDVTGSSGITATASANGITFINVGTWLQGTSANQGAILVANKLIGGSPSSMTVTINLSGGNATGADIGVLRVSGMSNTGARAVRQFANNDNLGNGTTPNIVFANACLTSNVVIVGISNVLNPAAITPPTNFTERGDGGYSTPTHGFEWATRDSGHTSKTVTWGAAAGTVHGEGGIELDTSAADIGAFGVQMS